MQVCTVLFVSIGHFPLQCIDTVGWAAGRASGLYKTEWWGAGVVICLKVGADLHMAQLMALPLTVSCSSKIQIDFTFLVQAHPSSPGHRAVKRVCVCVMNANFVFQQHSAWCMLSSPAAVQNFGLHFSYCMLWPQP